MTKRLATLAPLLAIAGLACAGAARLPPAALPFSRMDLPWWKTRFAAKQAELQAGPVGLVWYGDSITQQFEQAGPEAWRNFKPVWDRFYAPRHAINLGFIGDATSHLLWRIENGEAAGIHPKLAIILIGANNFGHLHWPAAPTLQGIETIVTTLHARLPGTRLLLLSVLPSIRNPWVDQNTAALNHDLAVRYASGTEAVFQDLTPVFHRTAGGTVDPNDFVDPHLTPPAPPLHPSAPTMERIAEAIEPNVSHLMGDTSRAP